jgi:predicted unusual protein kinase regulating ubiquinone biosynthesis (AarF/ABC1/UbiB family)
MFHEDSVAGAEMILQMVFSDNYWHGDLHPGNIIVQHLPQVPTN